jgi:hypothetical protein
MPAVESAKNVIIWRYIIVFIAEMLFTDALRTSDGNLSSLIVPGRWDLMRERRIPVMDDLISQDFMGRLKKSEFDEHLLETIA